MNAELVKLSFLGLLLAPLLAAGMSRLGWGRRAMMVFFCLGAVALAYGVWGALSFRALLRGPGGQPERVAPHPVALSERVASLKASSSPGGTPAAQLVGTVWTFWCVVVAASLAVCAAGVVGVLRTKEQDEPEDP